MTIYQENKKKDNDSIPNAKKIHKREKKLTTSRQAHEVFSKNY